MIRREFITPRRRGGVAASRRARSSQRCRVVGFLRSTPLLGSEYSHSRQRDVSNEGEADD